MATSLDQLKDWLVPVIFAEYALSWMAEGAEIEKKDLSIVVR